MSGAFFVKRKGRRMFVNVFTKVLLPLCILAQPFSASLAASKYTASMRDMQSINAMLHRYLMGLDKRDADAIASAFVEEGSLMLFENGKLMINLKGQATVRQFVSAPPKSAGEGVSAIAGENGGVTDSKNMANSVPKEMFHFISNDYYDFISPTEARHYAYWLDISPAEGRVSVPGIPGHYEDVLVKRKGQWYILERRIYVGTK